MFALDLKKTLAAFVNAGVTDPETIAVFFFEAGADVGELIEILERGGGGVGEWELELTYKLKDIASDIKNGFIE